MTLEDAYERFQGEIVGHLRKTFRDGDLAEDAAQQAFSRLVFSLPGYQQMPDAALRAWLFATARNALLDQLRRRKRLSYSEVPEHIPGAQGMEEADRLVIRDAVRTLTDTQRQLVRLRYGQGYNSTEISALLGMTAANVRYHLMTAMRRLRRELEEDFK